MARWLAPIGGAVSLLVLLAGLFRAETDQATTAGVSLVLWGLAGLVLAGAAAGLVELSARRAPAGRGPAGRPPSAREAGAPRVG